VHPWYELTKHNIVRHPIEKPLMIKHDEVLNKFLSEHPNGDKWNMKSKWKLVKFSNEGLNKVLNDVSIKL